MTAQEFKDQVLALISAAAARFEGDAATAPEAGEHQAHYLGRANMAKSLLRSIEALPAPAEEAPE